MRLALFFALMCLGIYGECKISRLLVVVDSQASFTAEEFAEASQAALISLDPRNPYKSLHDCFLETPYVVVSKYTENENAVRTLGIRYGYRYKEFSEGSLEDAVVQAQHLLEKNPKSPSEIDSLSYAEQQNLYALMGKIDEVLTQGKILYWAGRETSLGAAYYQGLRPWDDYLHLFILDLDEGKLKQLQEEFDKAGLVLHAYKKDFYKIFDKEGFLLDDLGEILPFRYPAANIFVMTLEKRNEAEDVYVHRSENFYSYWSFDRFDYFQIQNIKRASFGPMTIPIPGDIDLYLNRVYGLPGYPDLWRKYAQERCWEHRTESRVPSGACFVELEEPLFSAFLINPAS